MLSVVICVTNAILTLEDRDSKNFSVKREHALLRIEIIFSQNMYQQQFINFTVQRKAILYEKKTVNCMPGLKILHLTAILYKRLCREQEAVKII